MFASVLLAVMAAAPVAPGAADLTAALDLVPATLRADVAFLLDNMPARDRAALSADFLVDEVTLAADTFAKAPWRDSVPRDVYLNAVLPYASVTERRESWRRMLHDRCAPLVKDARTPGEAALILNRELFPLLNVKYSTGRARPDQAPSESIEQGLASCTGLTILLVNACRSVGVPARFVGTPLWPDGSGNHSWVEVWDDGGWHFTGAAEPAEALDRAWFTRRASTCVRDDPKHAIYAVSFERTPLPFPVAWDETADWIHAVNVTDRYADRAPLAPGHALVRLRVVNADGHRVAASVRVVDSISSLAFEGTSRDEGFDANDHLEIALPRGKRFVVEAALDEARARRRVKARRGGDVVTLTLRAAPRRLSP